MGTEKKMNKINIKIVLRLDFAKKKYITYTKIDE